MAFTNDIIASKISSSTSSISSQRELKETTTPMTARRIKNGSKSEGKSKPKSTKLNTTSSKIKNVNHYVKSFSIEKS